MSKNPKPLTPLERYQNVWQKLKLMLSVPLVRRLISLTTLLIIMGSVFLGVILYVQERNRIRTQTLRDFEFIEFLLKKNLMKPTLEPDDIDLILQSYASVHKSTELILFNGQGQVIAQSGLHDEPRLIENLPIWRKDLTEHTSFYNHHLTLWRLLPHHYALYVRQALPSIWFNKLIWVFIVGVPFISAFVALFQILPFLWGFFKTLRELVEFGQNIDNQPNYKATVVPTQDIDLQILGHTLTRISYRYHLSRQLTVEQQQFKQRIVESNPDILLQTDLNARIVFINTSFERITGLSRSQALGRPLIEMVSALTPEDNLLLQHIEQGTPQHVRLQVNLAGYAKQFDLWLDPVFDTNGQPLGLSGSLHDITGYQQELVQRRLSQKNMEQEIADHKKMLATMSHELRTPLNGILGMAQLLQETEPTQEQADYLRTLQNSGQSMLYLINDILDLSKLEANKMQTEIIEFDVLQLCMEVCDLMVGNAIKKDLELLCFVDPKCPRFVKGDPYRIRQILLNLLSNAIKFTSTGYIALQVNSIIPDADYLPHQPIERSYNAWLGFEVQDSGIGIPAEQQSDLFGYFAQANQSVSRLFGGTGLGLAISRGLAEAMHGYVRLASTAHQGTTFTLCLPFNAEHSIPVYQRPAALPDLQVAVFDGNVKNQQGLQRLFAAMQIVCCMFNHLTDLMQLEQEIRERDKLPILLIDYAELELKPLEMWLATYPRLKQAYCILLSMHPLRGIPEPLYAGFDGFVQKPIRVEHLIAELLRVTNEDTQQNVNIQPKEEQQRLMREFFAQVKRQPELPKFEQAQGKGLKVLVAEDHPVNQKVASKMLQRLGCEVVLAGNGQQAIEALELYPDIDMVLMDCRMPEMDGLEATQYLRQHGYSLPIVALTANDTDEDRDACRDAGMDDFLPKPLAQESLKSIIERYRVLKH